MSLFGDLDANDVSSGLKAGVYPGVIKSIEAKKSKDKEDGSGGMPFLVITYHQVQGYDFDIQDWQALAPKRFADMDNEVKAFRTKKDGPLNLTEREHWERQARFLKTKLENLGVPVERMNTATAEDLNEDLAGEEVILTTWENGDFPGIRKAVLKGASGTTLPARKAAPVITSPAKAETKAPAPVDESDDENPFDD